MPRCVIVYHYFEVDAVHRGNLEFFLRHGHDDECDFVIVIAGGCDVELPTLPNIRYLHIPNTGFDFSGYAVAVNSTIDLDSYGHFVFLNSSVRGPFLPAYCRTPWRRVFTDMLDGDVRLAGATINILHDDCDISERFFGMYGFPVPHTHVQSMVFCMDRTALDYLIAQDFFNRPIGPVKKDVIAGYELLMSQLILRRGWNINCLLPEYRNLDYRLVERDINPSSGWGDPCVAGGYFHRSISPYEAVFVKANRDVIGRDHLDLLSASQGFHDHPDRSAYQASRFDAVLREHASAWKGHKPFAMWLVRRLQSDIIVDLGVDYGFSTCCFAAPRIGHVFGIDAFEGDEQTGFRDTQAEAERAIARLGLRNVTLVKGQFEQVAQGWSHGIDILHIDGRHLYEDVQEDFWIWQQFLKPGGVILLHDTGVAEFGVRRFYDEIDWPKLNLWNSHGLGVVSHDAGLITEIAATFEKLVEPA